eukprot:7391844-Prymnesium_polylepis.1
MPAPKRTLARNTAPMAPSCTVPQHSLPRGLRLPLLPIAGGMPTRTSSNLARLERRLGLVEEGQEPLMLVVLRRERFERGAAMQSTTRARGHMRLHVVRPTPEVADGAPHRAVCARRMDRRTGTRRERVRQAGEQLALVVRLERRLPAPCWLLHPSRHGTALHLVCGDLVAAHDRATLATQAARHGRLLLLVLGPVGLQQDVRAHVVVHQLQRDTQLAERADDVLLRRGGRGGVYGQRLLLLVGRIARRAAHDEERRALAVAIDARDVRLGHLARLAPCELQVVQLQEHRQREHWE